jgi:hypothetical protein
MKEPMVRGKMKQYQMKLDEDLKEEFDSSLHLYKGCYR